MLFFLQPWENVSRKKKRKKSPSGQGKQKAHSQDDTDIVAMATTKSSSESLPKTSTPTDQKTVRDKLSKGSFRFSVPSFFSILGSPEKDKASENTRENSKLVHAGSSGSVERGRKDQRSSARGSQIPAKRPSCLLVPRERRITESELEEKTDIGGGAADLSSTLPSSCRKNNTQKSFTWSPLEKNLPILNGGASIGMGRDISRSACSNSDKGAMAKRCSDCDSKGKSPHRKCCHLVDDDSNLCSLYINGCIYDDIYTIVPHLDESSPSESSSTSTTADIGHIPCNSHNGESVHSKKS